MGLLTGNDQLYYAGAQQFEANGSQTSFEIEDFVSSISSIDDIYIYVNNYLVESGVSWTFPNVVFNTPPEANSNVYVVLKSHKYGGYRYTSLTDMVNNFMVAYVGDGKLINRANRRDILFHTKRAIQEFSYDILRSEKIQEVEVGPSLTIPMPRDYVNYVALSYIDDYGIEHPIPLGRITSQPSEAIAQDDQGNYVFSANTLETTSSVTDQRFDNFNEDSVTMTFGNLFPSIDFVGDILLHYEGSIPVKINDLDFFADDPDGFLADLWNLGLLYWTGVWADENGVPLTDADGN